jgi:hypothetical protein
MHARSPEHSPLASPGARAGDSRGCCRDVHSCSLAVRSKASLDEEGWRHRPAVLKLESANVARFNARLDGEGHDGGIVLVWVRGWEWW